jgi:hypothetical protein
MSIFEGPFKLEILRILIALSILIIGNLSYLLLSQNIKHFTSNKMAYLGTWITIAVVLGVCLVYEDVHYEYEDNNDNSNKYGRDYHYKNAKRDFVYLGILVALLLYIPMFGWLKSVKNITNAQFVYFSAFAIIITALASLFTYIIATKNNLHPGKDL